VAGRLGVVVLSQNRSGPLQGPCRTLFYIPELRSVRMPESGAMLLAFLGGSGLSFLQPGLSLLGVTWLKKALWFEEA